MGTKFVSFGGCKQFLRTAAEPTISWELPGDDCQGGDGGWSKSKKDGDKEEDLELEPGLEEERCAFALWSAFLSARVATVSFFTRSIMKPVFPQASTERAFRLQI